MRAKPTTHPAKKTCSLVPTLAVFALLVATPLVFAQTTTFTHKAADGTVTFSDAPIRQGVVVRTTYKGVVRKATIANPCKGLSVAELDARAQQLSGIFAQAAASNALDVNLLKAVARAESCFDPKAVSHAGAKGLMQLMPATATELGVTDIFDTQQNLSGGARYLSQMLQRYANNLDLALAAYNAGPGNVDRYDGVPPFKETQRYIVSVRTFEKHFADASFGKQQLASGER